MTILFGHLPYYVKTAGVVMCATCSDSQMAVVLWDDAHSQANNLEREAGR